MPQHGLGNLVILAQVTAFLLTFIVSFFQFIPLWVNQNEFRGHCLLFSKGTWLRNNTLQITEWGVSSTCNYNIFIGVMSMIVSLGYLILMSVYLVRNMDVSWRLSFVNVIVAVTMSVLLLIASLILTMGFQSWCRLLNVGNLSCDDEEVDFLTDRSIDSQDFYIELGMSQFGSWMAWFCWLILSLLGVIKICQFSSQESFLHSLSRERERLLQRIGRDNPYA